MAAPEHPPPPDGAAWRFGTFHRSKRMSSNVLTCGAIIGLVAGLRHRGAPTVELGTELDWFLCQQADGTRSSRDAHTLSVTLATAIAARGTIEKDQAWPVGARGIILANS